MDSRSKNVFYSVYQDINLFQKLLSGETNVLEVGCGDGFYSRIVAQTVKKLTAIDFDDKFISEAKNISSKKWPIQFIRHDIISSPLKKENFSAIYSLDVFEHIEKKNRINSFLTVKNL